MSNNDLQAWLIVQITRKPPLEVLFSGFCKKPETPIVTSATFAAMAGRKLRSLGFHALRGVSEPVEIFTPPDRGYKPPCL